MTIICQQYNPFRLTGQIRDVNQVLHSVTHFRLSVRDISWKPASSILARRLLSDAVTSYTVNENKVVINGGNIKPASEINKLQNPILF